MKRLNEQLTPSADLCSVAARARRERLPEDDRALKTDGEENANHLSPVHERRPAGHAQGESKGQERAL